MRSNITTSNESVRGAVHGSETVCDADQRMAALHDAMLTNLAVGSSSSAIRMCFVVPCRQPGGAKRQIGPFRRSAHLLYGPRRRRWGYTIIPVRAAAIGEGGTAGLGLAVAATMRKPVETVNRTDVRGDAGRVRTLFALPLAATAPLVPAVSALRGPVSSTPLTVHKIVTLALANDPDLRATRLKRGIAAARRRRPRSSPILRCRAPFCAAMGAGTVAGVESGTGPGHQKLRHLSCATPRCHCSTRQGRGRYRLQEWQVAGQARQLATDIIIGTRSRPTYVAATISCPTATASSSVRSRPVRDARHRRAGPRRAAGGAHVAQYARPDPAVAATPAQRLLGLTPDAVVPLVATPEPALVRPACHPRRARDFADRRPDLLALRLGYAAADAQLRVAICRNFLT